MTLFKKYIEDGKLSEALLVGRNLLNKNPGNAEIFGEYFDYLCSLAEKLPSLDDRQSFAEQAGVALAFYKENAELSEIVVEQLLNYENRITAICNEIDALIKGKFDKEQEEIHIHNGEGIKSLYLLKDKLGTVSNKSEFDAILMEIGNVDISLNKDAFTQEQSAAYDSLTKEHTDLISAKMRELEYKENIAYNKKAAEAFATAFKQFKDNEGKYKNHTQLFSLASTTLFAYDAGKLFNETLIYYNHVYSYIFSKLDDEGKLALTRYSIECERKLK